jgi:hypothetical protein
LLRLYNCQTCVHYGLRTEKRKADKEAGKQGSMAPRAAKTPVVLNVYDLVEANEYIARKPRSLARRSRHRSLSVGL